MSFKSNFYNFSPAFWKKTWMSEHRLLIYQQVDTATDFQFYY